jgi:hypothetical protein
MASFELAHGKDPAMLRLAATSLRHRKRKWLE